MPRYALKRSDIFVCDCQAVQDKAKAFTDYPDERIVQFPWGVDANSRAADDATGLKSTRAGRMPSSFFRPGPGSRSMG